jgi:hypothetical protein
MVLIKNILLVYNYLGWTWLLFLLLIFGVDQKSNSSLIATIGVHPMLPIEFRVGLRVSHIFNGLI